MYLGLQGRFPPTKWRKSKSKLCYYSFM